MIKSITSEKKYTGKQIRAVLGNPDSYDTQKGIYGETWSYYYYKEAQFNFSDGQLLGLDIQTNKYPVMTDKVSGGVKVGDNLRAFGVSCNSPSRENGVPWPLGGFDAGR